MKKSAFLINTARGAIVNEGDLAKALREGTIAGAGLDVFTTEPLTDDSPLRALDNVLLTPHIGWKVDRVLHEFVQIAAGHLEHWLKSNLPPGIILNPDSLLVERERTGGITSS